MVNKSRSACVISRFLDWIRLKHKLILYFVCVCEIKLANQTHSYRIGTCKTLPLTPRTIWLINQYCSMAITIDTPESKLCLQIFTSVANKRNPYLSWWTSSMCFARQFNGHSCRRTQLMIVRWWWSRWGARFAAGRDQHFTIVMIEVSILVSTSILIRLIHLSMRMSMGHHNDRRFWRNLYGKSSWTWSYSTDSF